MFNSTKFAQAIHNSITNLELVFVAIFKAQYANDNITTHPTMIGHGTMPIIDLVLLRAKC